MLIPTKWTDLKYTVLIIWQLFMPQNQSQPRCRVSPSPKGSSFRSSLFIQFSLSSHSGNHSSDFSYHKLLMSWIFTRWGIPIPYIPSIPFLVYQKGVNTSVCQKTYAGTLTAVLFKVVQSWKTEMFLHLQQNK